MSKPFHYGGQAVIEGVMIRGRQHVALAVRRPDGTIFLRSEPLDGSFYQTRWATVPLVRGVLFLWENLLLGSRMLMLSAGVAMGEEDSKASSGAMWAMLAPAFLAAAAIFFAGPLFIASWLDNLIANTLLSNIVEGVIRLLFFLAYIWGIGLMPDIRRVFAYHGAEHQAVNALEHGASLDPASVSHYQTAHTRCGTGFLLNVLLLSIVVFALLGKPPLVLRYASRVVLIPAIAAVGYELLRLGADHFGNIWVKALLSPGLALQALTTRQPEAAQVEVAIVALKEALAADAANAGA
ncbi:MAG: DUF1385 domain-containing protein [Dehalococcoidia bacterium]|nr:DUF1385 domain-containing protein [Dehalococcoidia bacterium]